MGSKREEFARNYAQRIKTEQSTSEIDRGLRKREVPDDPMLEYFREKEKQKTGNKRVPQFHGHYPPNRYNIRPGYRWDGVDRSNGHEKKLLERTTRKKAREEEEYRDATRDL